MVSLALGSFKVQEQEVRHVDLLKNALNSAPKEGFVPEEMRKRLKVLDKLETAGTSVDLEDAEAETLKSAMADMKWALLNKDILDLCDAVKAL